MTEFLVIRHAEGLSAAQRGIGQNSIPILLIDPGVHLPVLVTRCAPRVLARESSQTTRAGARRGPASGGAATARAAAVAHRRPQP